MMPRKPPKKKCVRPKKKVDESKTISEGNQSDKLRGKTRAKSHVKKSKMSKLDRFMKLAFAREDHPPWQNPPVFVRFSDGKVREKLQQMMGTDYVKLSDREFMGQLAINRNRAFEEDLRKRIRSRMDWEVQRRKQLILDGVLPVTEVTALSDHPIIKLTTEVKSIVSKRKAVLEKQILSKRKVPHFNYRLIENYGGSTSTPSELSIVSSKDSLLPDIVAEAKEIHKEVLYIEREDRTAEEEKIMEMYVYIPPDVKRLKESSTVDEMYARADEVLGQWELDKEVEKEQQIPSTPGPNPTLSIQIEGEEGQPAANVNLQPQQSELLTSPVVVQNPQDQTDQNEMDDQKLE